MARVYSKGTEPGESNLPKMNIDCISSGLFATLLGQVSS